MEIRVRPMVIVPIVTVTMSIPVAMSFSVSKSMSVSICVSIMSIFKSMALIARRKYVKGIMNFSQILKGLL